jgi:chaperone modulatory protein CbpM
MSREESVDLAVVARGAGVRISLVRRYLEFGLFEANPERSEAPRYPPDSAARVARAERLRRDLGLNHAGAVLVCELLDRIRELERPHAEGPPERPFRQAEERARPSRYGSPAARKPPST